MTGSADRPSPRRWHPRPADTEPPSSCHPVEHRSNTAEHGRTPEPGAACHAESVHVRSPSAAWRGHAWAAAALLLAACAADARTPSAAVRARSTSTTSAPTTTTTTSTLPVTPIAWTPCNGDLQCGTLTVPLDYARAAWGHDRHRAGAAPGRGSGPADRIAGHQPRRSRRLGDRRLPQ